MDAKAALLFLIEDTSLCTTVFSHTLLKKVTSSGNASTLHNNVGGRGLEYFFDVRKCNVEVYICCDSFRFLTSFFLEKKNETFIIIYVKSVMM